MRYYVKKIKIGSGFGLVFRIELKYFCLIVINVIIMIIIDNIIIMILFDYCISVLKEGL